MFNLLYILKSRYQIVKLLILIGLISSSLIASARKCILAEDMIQKSSSNLFDTYYSENPLKTDPEIIFHQTLNEIQFFNDHYQVGHPHNSSAKLTFISPEEARDSLREVARIKSLHNIMQ